MTAAQPLTAAQAQTATQAALAARIDEMLERDLAVYWDASHGALTPAFDAAIAAAVAGGGYGVDLALGVIELAVKSAPAVMTRSTVINLLHDRLADMLREIEGARNFGVEMRVGRAGSSAITVSLRVTWLPRGQGKASDLL